MHGLKRTNMHTSQRFQIAPIPGNPVIETWTIALKQSQYIWSLGGGIWSNSWSLQWQNYGSCDVFSVI